MEICIMGDISENFDRSEFACNDGCGRDIVDIELIQILEVLRLHFGSKVYINSGNRCHVHNSSIGSKSTSQHTLGKAADVRVENVQSKIVYNFLTMRYPGRFGFIMYQRFTHIDCRSIPFRDTWNKDK